MLLIEHGGERGRWMWSMTRVHPGPAFNRPTNGTTEGRGEAARARGMLAGVLEVVRDRRRLAQTFWSRRRVTAVSRSRKKIHDFKALGAHA